MASLRLSLCPLFASSSHRGYLPLEPRVRLFTNRPLPLYPTLLPSLFKIRSRSHLFKRFRSACLSKQPLLTLLSTSLVPDPTPSFVVVARPLKKEALRLCLLTEARYFLFEQQEVDPSKKKI